MSRCKRWSVVVLTFCVSVLVVGRSYADPIPEKMQASVNKGLEWLKKTQGKDGTWSANGQNPVAMTSLAGAGHAHGRKHRHAGQIPRQHPPGRRLADDPQQQGRQPQRPHRHARQSERIGPLHVRPRFRHALSGLRATARKTTGSAATSSRKSSRARSSIAATPNRRKAAGFTPPRPKGTTATKAPSPSRRCKACAPAATPASRCRRRSSRRATTISKQSTTPDGGVVYSLGRGGIGAPAGGGRPALTAAAIACFFSAGEYKDENVKKWFKFCERQIPTGGSGGGGTPWDMTNTPTSTTPPPSTSSAKNGWGRCSPATAKDDCLTLEQVSRRLLRRASVRWPKRRRQLRPTAAAGRSARCTRPQST